MNKKSKILTAISATVVAGALTFGAVASAAGTGGGAGNNTGTPGTNGGQARTHLTTQQKCDHAAQVEAKVTTMKQRIDQRLATLKDRKAQADAAGNTTRSARIQQRIDRLTQNEARIDAKYAKFESFVQANCTSGATTTTGA
jgi:hypothetical protein